MKLRKKYLIINADDFGLSFGINKAIKKAYKKGILTSVSLLVTTPAYNNALLFCHRNHNLGIGIHLTLTLGRSVLSYSKIPTLVDNKKYFNLKFIDVLWKSYTDKFFIKHVRLELEAQIQKLLKNGIIIDHIDSQQHIHMIPKIFNIVRRLARKYKIRHIRIPNEKIYKLSYLLWILKISKINFFKFIIMKILLFYKINKKVDFFGILFSSKINNHVIIKIFEMISNKYSELLIHPGLVNKKDNEYKYLYKKQNIYNFIIDQARTVELSTIINPEIKKLITINKIKLIRFRDISY